MADEMIVTFTWRDPDASNPKDGGQVVLCLQHGHIPNTGDQVFLNEVEGLEQVEGVVRRVSWGYGEHHGILNENVLVELKDVVIHEKK